MIDVVLPSASQSRFFPPKAARRNRKPLPAQDRRSLSKRRACLPRSQNSAQKSPSSSLPPPSIPAVGAGTSTSASSTSLKSP
jgi:hypothetical protein